MVNINTSGAQSGRDFSYGASPVLATSFIELYNEIVNKIDMLAMINDETTFNIELNKIRKKMRKLINDHFNRSISQLKTVEQFKLIAENHESNLNSIVKELTI